MCNVKESQLVKISILNNINNMRKISEKSVKT